MNEVWIVGYIILAGIQLIELFLLYKLINYVKQLSNRSFSNGNRDVVISELEVGSKISFYEELPEIGRKKNVPTIIIFFSPNCSYCKNIIPQFNEIEISPDLNLLTLSSDGDPNSISVYSESLKENNIPFIVSNDMVQSLKVKAFPTYFIVDNNGKLVEKGIVKDLSQFAKYGIKKKQALA